MRTHAVMAQQSGTDVSIQEYKTFSVFLSTVIETRVVVCDNE